MQHKASGEHADHLCNQWQAQQGGGNEYGQFFAQRFGFAVAVRLFFVFGSAVGKVCFKACVLNLLYQLLLIYLAADGAHIGAFQGQIHIGLEYAGHPHQRLLNTSRTSAAGHTAHLETKLTFAHAKTGIADGAGHGRGIGAVRIELHICLFGGEVDSG